MAITPINAKINAAICPLFIFSFSHTQAATNAKIVEVELNKETLAIGKSLVDDKNRKMVDTKPNNYRRNNKSGRFPRSGSLRYRQTAKNKTAATAEK